MDRRIPPRTKIGVYPMPSQARFGDAELVELPLLLDRIQAERLEALAEQEGLSVAQYLRRLIHAWTHD
jgi:hypothetical protein